MLIKNMVEVPNYLLLSYTYTVCVSHFLDEAPLCFGVNIAKTKIKANC